MKLIKLTQGKFAKVDDEDFEFLNQWRWCTYTSRNGRIFYAIRSVWTDGKCKTIQMHRLIMGISDRSILVDHKDHDGTNNQRENLRGCTSQQNIWNSTSNKTTGYKGVRLKNRRGRFTAEIFIDGARVLLGCFDRAIEAALA